MKMIIIILLVVIFILLCILWNYQRQIKKICRQLSFLKKHESNMLISGNTRAGGFGELADEINEILQENKYRNRIYEEKEKDIAEIYTNLSHDIRTPLTSLEGYFELLKDCESEDDKKRYIGIIKERISSLNDMLEELFTFTKLKNDSYKLEMMDCNLNQILKEIILSYYENWIEKGIEPVLDIIENPLYIKANVQALRRTIQNVVKNVLEHGQKEIRISLKRIDKIAVVKISNRVLHPEEIDITKVFDRFYKADKTRGTASTGLGLSIAYGFVKKMDGDIRAELEENIFSVVMEFTENVDQDITIIK